MAGIYIHIPFCKSRCIYCDYFTSTNESEMNLCVSAILKEAILRREGYYSEVVNTIYFGGGTPSRLNEKHFREIFDLLYANYTIDPKAEITIEANPDDLTEDYIKTLASLPFNRISIGIQSFDDDELKFLSRRHNSKAAIKAVYQCQQHGFKNISIDLMYGLPNQTLTVWQNSLEEALKLDVQHISAYHLIYEDKTKLYSMLKAGKVSPVDEEFSVEMFETLIQTLKDRNFIQYEISNFAKEGYISQHNSSYWKGCKYLGFGPSAHSFDGKHRWWNISSMSKYIEGANKGELNIEIEEIDKTKQYNEYLITGLRTIWGINIKDLEKNFNNQMLSNFINSSKKYFDLNYMQRVEDTISLTHKGVFISDGIISDLLII